MPVPPSQPLIRLSQGQLNLLEVCPRKFQHVYLEQLGEPISPEQQERLNWGSRFHLLMQQRELGLPVERLVAEDLQLQHWVTALVNAAPEVLTPDPRTIRDAEHCRTLNFRGYLLTAIYDLLIEDEERAQILDWKTYPLPKDRQRLARDWQTRLYLYILAETSDYLPEQLSMTYWFVKSRPHPQRLQFTYSSTQHETTRQDLTRLLAQLEAWLNRYWQDDIPFPQVPEERGHCVNCSFAVRCQRNEESGSNNCTDLLPDLAEVREVSL
jgi:hypothetical protein